mmetsp:Transcript_11285/g.26757  ORF Transcript_11285/g.26757 Transcript_11285/m.26757 type:complete len:196 (-) Transcript_11285:88-675(-)
MLRCLAILGVHSHPVMSKLAQVAEARHRESPLPGHESRQLFFAYLLCKDESAPWSLSDEMRSHAALHWISQILKHTPSKGWAVQRIGEELRLMGIEHDLSHNSPDQVLRVEVLLQTTDGKSIAVKILRRGRDCMQNSSDRTGGSLSWSKLASQRGYIPLEIYEAEVAKAHLNASVADLISAMTSGYDLKHRSAAP